MVDPRFFQKANALTLGALAKMTNSACPADKDTVIIDDVASLTEAGANEIGFFENPKYRPELEKTKARAVFIKAAEAAHLPTDTIALITETPYQAFALAMQGFYPAAIKGDPLIGCQDTPIHPSAQIEEGVEIGRDVTIGANVEIGRGTKIAAGVVIGHGCTIGRDCRIGAHNVIAYACLGDRIILHPHCAIGQDGFGFAPATPAHIKVPQLGRVMIQNDVEIGAQTTIDRGTIPDTMIGEGTKIDNQCHFAHNVRIGRHCLIAGRAAASGSTVIGDYVMIGGQVCFAGHLTIGDRAVIQGASVVINDVPPEAVYSGHPARPVQQWRREQAALARLAKRDSNKSQ